MGFQESNGNIVKDDFDEFMLDCVDLIGRALSKGE